MNGNYRPVQRLIASSLLVSLLGLSACGRKNEDGAQAAADASATSAATAASAVEPASAAPVAYTPPSADQLYQMVAPIALFPDKLVALVLAGSTYPDQITAANTWLGQNPNLKGQALAASADQQSWDPSVKALTAFPAVLSQMATNLAWTTSLGQAYYNDPTDVLNAIQVMRQRAQTSGNLCTTSQMRVTRTKQTSAPRDYTPAPATPGVYEGPSVIPAPAQAIVIEPAQPDVVYVPSYNPALVYGAPVAAYPGYLYHPPVYAPGAVVAAGVISFGIGITVGAMLSHVGWGWHAWGMHWGGPPPGGPGGPRWGGWQRPAVVFNHTTYVSRSTTVINQINNTRITNNYSGTVSNAFAHNGAPPAAMAQMHAQMPRPSMRAAAPMTMPRFSANDARPGALPGARPGAGAGAGSYAHPSPRYGANHANVMATNHAQTSALHGNPMETHTRPEGHFEGSPQLEHQQVPHPPSQYATQPGRERPAEGPVRTPQPEAQAQAMQHRQNTEAHPQAPHEDFAQAHPAAPRQDVQHFTQPQPQLRSQSQAQPRSQAQAQPQRMQPRPPEPRPRPSAPSPMAHHADTHQHRS